MPYTESSTFTRVPVLEQSGPHDCVMGEVLSDIRDKVNYMIQEQKHIKHDVAELCNDRRNLVWGILAFVGMTVGGSIIWAVKHGA